MPLGRERAPASSGSEEEAKSGVRPPDDMSNHAAVRSSDAEARALKLITNAGVSALPVDDFVDDDVARWTDRPDWQVSIRETLDGIRRGDIEYLTIRSPSGDPIAKGGINFAERPGVGVLFQLDTVDELQSLGLGSRLIAEAEARIRRRGLTLAAMGVEDSNPRARALYERLGYAFLTRESVSWEVMGDDGVPALYETEVDVLVKDLSARVP